MSLRMYGQGEGFAVQTACGKAEVLCSGLSVVLIVRYQCKE